ncbi:MAG: class I SAM-dependent methyltransferase [Nanoarchaeota archaeon]
MVYANAKLSLKYDSYASEPGSCYNFHANTILDFADISQDSSLKVCEIGAGTGTTTLKLLNRLSLKNSFSLITEPDKYMIKKLYEKISKYPYKNCHILNCLGEEIAEKTDMREFDIIISNFTLMHLDLKKVLSNAYELLSPGKKFIGSFFSVVIGPPEKNDFYNIFDNKIRQYSCELNSDYQSPFKTIITYKDLELLSSSLNFKFEHKEIYRTENKVLFEKAFDLFIDRNFYKCLHSKENNLSKRTAIKVLKDLADETYNELGEFNYGVTFLIFTKSAK